MGYVGTKFDDMRETFLREGRQEERKEILELLGRKDRSLMEQVARLIQQEFSKES